MTRIYKLDLLVTQYEVAFRRVPYMVKKEVKSATFANNEIEIMTPDDLREPVKRIYSGMLGAVSDCSNGTTVLFSAWATQSQSRRVEQEMKERMTVRVHADCTTAVERNARWNKYLKSNDSKFKSAAVRA